MARSIEAALAGVLLALGVAAPAEAALLVVDDDYNGSDPASACAVSGAGAGTQYFSDLESAVAASRSGTGPYEIAVCPGSYRPQNKLKIDRPSQNGLTLRGVTGNPNDVRVRPRREFASLKNVSSVTIEALRIQGSTGRNTIELEETDAVTMRQVVISRTRRGIFGKYVLGGQGVRNLVLDNVRVSGARSACVYIPQGNGLTVRGGEYRDCSYDGIYFINRNRGAVTIENTKVLNAPRSTCVLVLAPNVAADSGPVTVRGSEVSGCGFSALNLDGATNLVVEDNTITNARGGVVIGRSETALIRRNDIDVTAVQYSSAIVIHSFGVTNIGEFYENCMTSDSLNVIPFSGNNLRFYNPATQRGNFWGPDRQYNPGFSETCPDADGNGICDTPFDVPFGGGTDLYPLTRCAAGTPTLDHFVIGHDGYGIHCVDETVTLRGADASGNTLSGLGVTVTLDTGTGRGSWKLVSGAGTLVDATPDDGVAQYTFAPGDGVVELALAYPDGPPTMNLSAVSGAVRDDDSEGTLRFAAAGFVVSPQPVAPQVAAQAFGLTLTAVGKLPGASCGTITSYSGDKPLKLWSTYLNPASGTLPVSVDGQPVAGAEAAASPQTVTFNAGVASINVRYDDAGAVALSMKDDSFAHPDLPGGIRGASGPIVVRPADLVVTSVRRSADGAPNPGASDASGPAFIGAGQPMTVRVEARNSLGAVTPGFGAESPAEGVALSASLLAPAGGANPALRNATLSRVAPGVFEGTTVAWDEVGVVSLQGFVADGDYLGSGALAGTASGPVGRFTPDRLDVAITQTPELSPSCGTFSYVGAPLHYRVAPAAQVTARSAIGAATTNYTGAFMKLSNASLAAAGGKRYTLATGAIDPASVPSDASDPLVSDLGGGAVELVFGSGSGLALQRGAPVAPFDIELGLEIDVVDADGVASPANPLRFGSPAPGAGMAFTGGAKGARWGRLVLSSVVGPHTAPLMLPLHAESFNGAGFVPDTDDSCSSYAASDLRFANPFALTVPPAATGGGVLVNGGADPASPLLLDSGGQIGSIDAILGVAPWLRYDWDGDGAQDDDPIARVTFGQFGGTDRVIERREVNVR